MSEGPGSSQADNRIAIVGMAARVPGANDPRSFWRNLCAGDEAIRFLDDDELAANGVEPGQIARPDFVRAYAGLADIRGFDADFFGLGPKEAAIMDPQHRHFLECAWEALEAAGHTPESVARSVGVFAGCGIGTYFALNILTNRQLLEDVGFFLLSHTGNDKDFLATRLSYSLNLEGPSISVQTACSTSLVATHLACQSLLGGECDLALAGGSTIKTPDGQGYVFKSGEILSPDGHCRPFDHKAAGTVFGSGVGVVALRRLEDALADGDHIHAVLLATAVNNDGAAKAGYLAPSLDGQAAAVSEALAVADITADTIEMIECHGTGTPIGDPIEVGALSQAFRESTDRTAFCRIGSVKGNIGHLDTAAGVIGLIKAALAVEKGKIPPNLHFERPNPEIDFENSAFVVNGELHEWRGTGPRRAGVNALGVGGTNAHAIVEQPPAPAPCSSPARTAQPIVVSARSPAALDAAAQRLAQFLDEESSVELADVAHTLRHGRRRFSHGRVVAGHTVAEVAELLTQKTGPRSFDVRASERPAKVAFLFPGAGPQHVGMGRDLRATESGFREITDRLLGIASKLVGVDLIELIDGPETPEVERQLERPSIQLPLVYVFDYAVARLWMDLGVQPVGMLGHSLGEYVAAAIAGVWSPEDGVALVHERGRLFESVTVESGMVTVELEPDRAAELGAGIEGLEVSVVNTPGNCVLSGPRAAIDTVVTELERREIDHRIVPIATAAHSSLLEPLLDTFRTFVAKLELRAPTIPFAANLTGRWIEDDEATDPDYWVKHFRHQVRFSDCLATIFSDPQVVMLECGPGRMLSSLAKRHPHGKGRVVLPSMRHPDEKVGDDVAFAAAAGRLWAAGVDIGFEHFTGPRRRRVPLPTYPFQHKDYWIEWRGPSAGSGPDQSQPPQPERFENVEDFFARLEWRPRAAPAAPLAVPEGSRFLVLLDKLGYGDAFVDELRRLDADVVVVREDDSFVERGSKEFCIAPEDGRAGFDRLVARLGEGDWSPTHVVSFWAVSREGDRRPGSSPLHHSEERGLYTLVYLIQALLGVGAAGPFRFVAVSCGMQRLPGDAPAEPEKSLVLGPARVLSRELPGSDCISVDIDRPPQRRLFGSERVADSSRRAIASDLLAECLSDGSATTIAIRGRERFELTNVKWPPPSASGDTTTAPSRVRQGGAYLITGGLGEIGRLFAARIVAAEPDVRLVLTARRGLPPREEWNNHARRSDALGEAIRAVIALERQGATVRVVAVDVTDIEAMRRIVTDAVRDFGALAGVVHAAGIVDDQLLQVAEAAAVESVLAPKVAGTLVLNELVSELPSLDFVFLFSSTSAWIAPAGQSAYVAANVFLDAFAESRSSATVPVCAVAWGIWREIGMAARAVGSRDDSGRVLATARATACKHPWLHECIGTAASGGIVDFRSSAGSSWVFDEHRTADGQAVFPGAAYFELVRGALAELGSSAQPPRGALAITDLFLFRPLVPGPDGEIAARVVVSLADDGGFEVRVEQRATTAGEGPWTLAAQAAAALTETATPAAATGRSAPTLEASAEPELEGAQQRRMRFGPRWSCLRTRNVDRDSGVVDGRLELRSSYHSDLESILCHPALMDVATGLGLELVDQSEGRLWVPVSCGGATLHHGLPPIVDVHVERTAHGGGEDRRFITMTVTLRDPESGTTLVELRDYTMRQADANSLASADDEGSAWGGGQEAAMDRHESPAERVFLENLSRGITPAEGAAAIDRLLAMQDLPHHVFVSSLSIDGLAAQTNWLRDHAAASGGEGFERPDLESTYSEPETATEKRLVEIWEDVLGVRPIGVEDSFFDLGGHSLIAVRLFARIKRDLGVDLPISTLLDVPDVRGSAAIIDEQAGASGEDSAGADGRFTYLVPLQGAGERSAGRSSGATAFFMVAGMFGNVMNLRHLASLVGSDRPVYGVQARGLFGGLEPHLSFEDMARDYLEEIRRVQPHGPYLLGGFSGGGITAYEMARQLRSQGEEVAAIVMLDTPVPSHEKLTRKQKAQIHLIHLKRRGIRYLGEWALKRARWELGRLRARFRGKVELDSSTYHSDDVRDAFVVAVRDYGFAPQPVTIHLFRPGLAVHYDLGDGVLLDAGRQRVREDNGWRPLVDEVHVSEVPGNHDSMVLEPNVRVVALRIRELLKRCDRKRAGGAGSRG